MTALARQSDACSRLRAAQRAWAERTGRPFDNDGYCLALDDNLYQPLPACSRRDLEAGKGRELGTDGSRGKLQALHSSAALVCNAFDSWRGRNLEALKASIGTDQRMCGMALEGKYPTGLRGTPPHVDVVLYGANGAQIAIESKFCEAYDASATKNVLKDKYFPSGDGLWEQAGLVECQALADRLRAGDVAFRNLDAAQLLKAGARRLVTTDTLEADRTSTVQGIEWALSTHLPTVAQCGPNRRTYY